MEKDQKLDNIRHSLAHLLAMAVRQENPKAKLAIGPTIENGFYYDFQFSKDYKISPERLSELENKIKHLIKENIEFKHIEISEDEAREKFKNEPYKLELIDEILERKEKLSFFQSGDFVDLCGGWHVKSTNEIDPKAFKLINIAGAYWKGDEKNKMLTRIYGVAFKNKKELDEYLKMQEEAEKRDHRKLGKELGLFIFSPLVGTGLPLFTPKGTIMRTELYDTLLEVGKKYGIQQVETPHIAKKKLYETSGHTEKFGNELLKVVGHHDEFVMKPVNCPHTTQIYASVPRSYRDLPLRFVESTMMYRDEKPGELGGLTRVRSITVDDGHIFCTTEQIKEEVKNIAHIIEEFYSALGMYGNHQVFLSVRDPENLDKYIGEEKDWRKAEKELQELSDGLNLKAKRIEGEAAIYGPKIDYVFKDSLERQWQLATIQIDFSMPKRFGLVYKNKKGEDETPALIHRAILGSYERFMAILIEHFAGAFPLWLSPVQVKVLPIGEAHQKFGGEVFEKLKENDIRTELDDSGETLGKKIRQGKMEKVPYMLVIGTKEVEEKKVTIENRDKGNQGTLEIDELIVKLKNEITKKSR
ncbi:MAG: threonine--tRNA ligase [Candidatus Pacebacteria bacterium]|jgi:threonyl-tRNA synthetase|nr:threonine--tRNA ligase [Candidatus Paceibacterota bacterium]|tara:strand:+ start:18481 stop:20235 length:1755 start_codon:yes stop_codon:yes gene_type:complete